jgi:FixJ family two-component response regulator
MMPGVSGRELYEEVCARSFDIAARFVFMTGGTPTAGIRDFLASSQRAWLEKPFDTSALLLLLERVASGSG